MKQTSIIRSPIRLPIKKGHRDFEHIFSTNRKRSDAEIEKRPWNSVPKEGYEQEEEFKASIPQFHLYRPMIIQYQNFESLGAIDFIFGKNSIQFTDSITFVSHLLILSTRLHSIFLQLEFAPLQYHVLCVRGWIE